MEPSELKEIQKLIESISPQSLVEMTAGIASNLSVSFESYSNLHAKTVVVADKLSKIANSINVEIEDLLSERSKIISENNKIFNERSEKAKILDTQIKGKEYQIDTLSKTIEDLSIKVNNSNKEIDGLDTERDTLIASITELSGKNQQSIRIYNAGIKEIADINTTKDAVAKQINDLTSEVERLNEVIKMKNNDIIIAEDRLNKTK